MLGELLVCSLRFAVMQVKCRLQQLLLRGITGCSYLNVECITLFACITLGPTKYKKRIICSSGRNKKQVCRYEGGQYKEREGESEYYQYLLPVAR